MSESKPNFFERTRAARKVLVPDLGFLGDTVHLLPALWMVRQAYPQAELHLMVAQHVMSLMDCLPWVDCVWGYSRFPEHASLAENLQVVRRLRKARFDVAINLNGSDRSSWLTWLSGANERLGRLPVDGGPLFWRSLFTEVVENPFFEEPAYLQKWHCLRKAGFPGKQAEFHLEFAAKDLQSTGLNLADARTFFHISPFTKTDEKELPLNTTANLIDALQDQFPLKRLAISCAPDIAERQKMQALLAKLKRKPWRVLPGSLTFTQLAGLIQQSALHLSGDTGTLHLALMAGVPTVSWFRTAEGMKAWIPAGAKHRTLLGTGAGCEGLKGLAVADVLEAVKALMGQEKSGTPGAP